jgi:hypothetical protein
LIVVSRRTKAAIKHYQKFCRRHHHHHYRCRSFVFGWLFAVEGWRASYFSCKKLNRETIDIRLLEILRFEETRKCHPQ